MKQKLINFFDTTGLTWFIPFTKLICGDSPKEQLKDIASMWGLPIVGLTVFFMVWGYLSTFIKTSSGQLPSPSLVWNQSKVLWSDYKGQSVKKTEFFKADELREEIDQLLKKRKEFMAAGKTTEVNQVTDQLIKVQQTINSKVIEYNTLSDKFAKVKEKADTEKQAEIDKLRKKYIAKKAFEYGEDGKPIVDANGEPKLITKATDEIKYLESLSVAPHAEIMARIYKETSSTFDKFSRDISKIEGKITANKELKAGEITPKVEKKIAFNNKMIEKTENSFSNKMEYAGSPTIIDCIKLSLITVCFGFLLAAFVGIPLGVLCGLSPAFATSSNPIIQICRPVSPLVWVLIMIQLVDGIFIGDRTLEGEILKNSFLQAGFTVTLCSLWATLSNTALGVSSVDPDHMNVAKVLKLSWFDKVFKIIIPSAAPYIFTGLRITLGIGWMVLIVSEMIASSQGLGWIIDNFYQNGKVQDMAKIITCLFIIGIIGFILDRIMYTLQKLVTFSDEVSA